MGANYIYEPVIHEQTAPVTTLEVTHDFGRRVNPCVYKDGVKIFPYLEELEVGGYFNKIRVSFYEKGVPVAIGGWVLVSS